MKKTLLLLTFFCAIFNGSQSLAEPLDRQEILGVWLNAAKDGYIEIFKKSDKIEGVIIGSPDPGAEHRLDVNNPDPKRRKQLLRGLTILTGFIQDGENNWTGGQVYDPNNGKTYKCKLELINNKKLAVRGYVGIPLFGRTEIWIRKE